MSLNLSENADAEQREEPGGLLDELSGESLAESVLSSLAEAVAIVRADHVQYINPAFTRLFGYSIEELGGEFLSEIMIPDTLRQEKARVEASLERHGSAALETVRIRKSGEPLDVALMATPLMVDGKRQGIVLSYRDIGERKRVEARLQHDAMHDPLTGLANRALFLDRLTQALARRTRWREQNCGVLFLDLDGFKQINDMLGHAAGDLVLTAVADRLSRALRPQDTAARLGGDEFAVLVDHMESAAALETVAGRVQQEMEQPYEVLGRFVHAGVSIGAAMAGTEHIAPELLIRDADMAMYRAKQKGGGQFEIFDKRLEVQVTSQEERNRELRELIEKRQFEFRYQPIFRLEGGKLEGFESLLCWQKDGGLAEDQQGLAAMAEETGLSISLGRETLENACRQLRVWSEALPKSDLTLTVNVTGRQFYHHELVAQIRRVLAATGVEPGRLLFEISEGTLNENSEAALTILTQMAGCDVRLAVDEFGSRLAPVNFLMRLPIEVVKLDRSLTMAATSRQRAVLQSLIQLGRGLGVQMVAQGIENAEQLKLLRGLGCELGQGTLLGIALEQARAQELAAVGRWGI